MKKSFLVIVTCIISVFVFQAFTTHQEPHWKNLKILSPDISEHDLDSVMHHFTAALGVRCNFCHVRNEEEKKMEFASDDKPEKNIARKMMLMAIDINKNYFKNMDHHDHDMDHDMSNDSAHHDMDHHDMDHQDIDTSVNGQSAYMLRTVTCYTCHRGDPHPESKTPPQQAGPRPPEPPKPMDKK